MDERRAHFLALLGDACVAARLADLEVEVVLGDGTTVRGVPQVQEGDGEDTVDDTGYRRPLVVDGSTIALDDVVSFSVLGG